MLFFLNARWTFMTSNSSSSTKRMCSGRASTVSDLSFSADVARPGEAESRPLPALRFQADVAALALDDLLHQRQPDARRLHLVPRFERLEDHEHLLVVLRVD